MKFCSDCFITAYCSKACQRADKHIHSKHCCPPESAVATATRKYLTKYDQTMRELIAKRIEQEIERHGGSIGAFLSHHSFLLAARYRPEKGQDSSKSVSMIGESLNCRKTTFCPVTINTMIEIKREQEGCKGVVAMKLHVIDNDDVTIHSVTKMWPLL
ncbi:hypothetical protein VNI00_007763 [Paramarasmius palmivorus]|uniref:MYND-type domain-containing protein n=1 Tax=Paramarasmius palmivorus TaxID=297713 RepID=A0AAW0CYT1_9AGAR